MEHGARGGELRAESSSPQVNKSTSAQVHKYSSLGVGVGLGLEISE